MRPHAPPLSATAVSSSQSPPPSLSLFSPPSPSYRALNRFVAPAPAPPSAFVLPQALPTRLVPPLATWCRAVSRGAVSSAAAVAAATTARATRERTQALRAVAPRYIPSPHAAPQAFASSLLWPARSATFPLSRGSLATTARHLSVASRNGVDDTGECGSARSSAEASAPRGSQRRRQRQRRAPRDAKAPQRRNDGALRGKLDADSAAHGASGGADGASARLADNVFNGGSGGLLEEDTVWASRQKTSPFPTTVSLRYKEYLGEIFCNRSLNMRSIKAVGFDMDYTLAHYIPETFETLAYEGALRRLVSAGYPREILDWKYDCTAFVRGLMIDKKRGNVLKMDRHKYVKLAYHGFRQMSKGERDKLYNPAVASWSAFAEPEYAVVDTLFSLPDAHLFSQLVELKDRRPDAIDKPYEEIYRDVRRSVDLCHRDGYIKLKVARDPGRFIHYDPHLIETLQRLRRSGRKMFLLTNSLWQYTNVVMNHLVGNAAGALKLDWVDLFDLVVVGANKPGFLTDSRLWMYRVDVANGDGALNNTDGVVDGDVDAFLRGGKIMQGGNFMHLHEILQLRSGSELLYVGDHMYSDILRSKRQLGWRTMLIIPELQHEIDVMLSADDERHRVEELRVLRDELDEWADRVESEAVVCRTDESEASCRRKREALERERARAAHRRLVVKDMLAAETQRYHTRFHPLWGQLFKTGYQNSRFAEQVEQYACLYTSKVSNLRLVSPELNFRCMSDLCPHDRLNETPMRRHLERRMDAEAEVEAGAEEGFGAPAPAHDAVAAAAAASDGGASDGIGDGVGDSSGDDHDGGTNSVGTGRDSNGGGRGDSDSP